MAYASANTEVLAYTGFSESYSTGTSPTLLQVTDIIEQVEGEIGGALDALGVTTVGSNLTDMVRKYSAMGSAGLTLQRYGKNDNDFRLADWFYGKFETWIDKLYTDEKYQEKIKKMDSASYTGLFISSNATDGTHIEATAKSTEISYEVNL